MKKFLLIIIAVMVYGVQTNVQSQTVILNEGFNDVTGLVGLGWVETNKSDPTGIIGYFQGNPQVFDAYQGADTAYMGANYNSTAGAGTISNWMITPKLTLQNGDSISFWTRTSEESEYPDRLQFYLNTQGTSNVGTDANSTGDFTVLIHDINPDYTEGGYPETWTQFTSIISGLSGPTECRLAFRYFVINGGPNGSISNYIGIDEFSVTRAGSSFIYENNDNSKNSFSVYPNPAVETIILKSNNSLNGNYIVNFTNELGQVVKSETMAISPNSEYRLQLGLPTGFYTISIIDNQSAIKGIQTLIVQ